VMLAWLAAAAHKATKKCRSHLHTMFPSLSIKYAKPYARLWIAASSVNHCARENLLRMSCGTTVKSCRECWIAFRRWKQTEFQADLYAR
jgi:hypothetical protein